MLDAGAKVSLQNKTGATALTTAAQNNCIKTVDLLLDRVTFTREELEDAVTNAVVSNHKDMEDKLQAVLGEFFH